MTYDLDYLYNTQNERPVKGKVQTWADMTVQVKYRLFGLSWSTNCSCQIYYSGPNPEESQQIS